MRSIYRLLPGFIPETIFGLLHRHNLENNSFSLNMLIPAALSIRMIRHVSPESFCGPAKLTCSVIFSICDIKTLSTSSSSQGTSGSTSESGSSGSRLQKPGTRVSLPVQRTWLLCTSYDLPDVVFLRLRRTVQEPCTYTHR